MDTLGKDHTALLTNPRLGRIYSDLRKMNNDTRVRGYAPDEQRGLVRKLVEERLTAPNGNWRSWEDIDIDFHREVVTPKETSLWDSGERTRVIRRSAEQKIEEEQKSSDLIDEVEEK